MSQKKFYIVVFCLILIVMQSTGCQPFRKKFVRKKKEDKREKFIPVLEPIEYPAKMHSSEDQYKSFYSLWKIWSSDYVKSLEEKDSDKKQKYTLVQSIKNLEEMKKRVVADKQKIIDDLMIQLNDLNSNYEKSVNMRSLYSMKSQMEKTMNRVRNELNPKVMTDQYSESAE